MASKKKPAKRRLEDVGVEGLRRVIGDHLLSIEDLFVSTPKITIVVRSPTIDDADIIVTNEEDLSDVEDVIQHFLYEEDEENG